MNYRYKKTSAVIGKKMFETTHFQNFPPTNNDLWIISKKFDSTLALCYILFMKILKNLSY